MATLSLLVAGTLATAPLAMAQQNAAQDVVPTETHRGEVVTAIDGKLTMTIDGKNQHTHRVAADAAITLNGRKAELNELMRGDMVAVTTAKDDRTTALKIAATRKDADTRRVETPSTELQQEEPAEENAVQDARP